MKKKSPVIEPEKAHPDSVQVEREKQQALGGETSTLGASNGSEDVLMDEPRLNSAELTLKQSATSASSADVTLKFNQSTTTPKAVTVPSCTSVAREPGKKIVEQSTSESEVPQASDQRGKVTKSGLVKGPLTLVVPTVTDSVMADNSKTSNSRRNSSVMANSIPASVTNATAKDPVPTTQSKLFHSKILCLYLSR
jgi:hypothetical protein